MKNDEHIEVKLPDSVPLMVLPEAMLFPHSVLPLFIFEQRYRDMLAWALANDRMFCVAMMKPGVSEVRSPDDFFHVSGLGLIRACVQNPDGTSHMILHGLQRVRFVGFDKSRPFYVARIEALKSELGDAEVLDLLSEQIIRLCKKLGEAGYELPESIAQLLRNGSEAELLGDVVGSAFVRHPVHRQALLEQPVVSERLRRLLAYLRTESE